MFRYQIDEKRLKIELQVPADLQLVTDAENRITSYNVCYTKLLRTKLA